MYEDTSAAINGVIKIGKHVDIGIKLFTSMAIKVNKCPSAKMIENVASNAIK